MSARATTIAEPRPDGRSRPLLDAVEAAPHAPRRVGVAAPGGYGKSVLLRELRRCYQRAGVAVLDAYPDLLTSVDLSPDRAAVVLVDDAHLLDDERLSALDDWVTRQRCGLVVSYRPWPRPAGLADLLRLAGPPLALGPFTLAQTSQFLGADADPAMAEFIQAQAGGVPRLVDRLATSLTWPATEVPSTALLPFRSELEELPTALRTLLLAAVTEVELTGDLLGALVEQDPAAADETVAASRATGLLGADGRLVPLARRAIALLTPAAQRTAVWRRLAELQLARGGQVLPLARSLREVGVGGTGLTGLFEAAAEEALAEQPELAAELFAAATASRPTAARRALAAALAGDLDLGLRLADPLITAEPREEQAAGAAVAATALAHRGQLGRSAELYRWSGTASSAAFATVGFIGTGQPQRADDPVPDGPPTLLASSAALLATGVRDTISGTPVAALSTLVQAAGLLEPAGQAVLLPDSPAALAALVALHSGELEVAESVLARASAVKMGARLMSRRHALLRAWILMVRGRTGEAAQQRAAVAADDGSLELRDLLFATALDVGIARRNSDLAALHRSWGSARETVMRHPVDLFTLLPLGELAIAAARLDEQARLAAHLQDAYQLLDRLGKPPLWSASLHWSGMHAAILAEEPATADEHVAALAATAEKFRYGAVLAAAAEVWVAVLRGRIDPESVVTAARELHGAGLWWDAARLAGQAAIRTADRRAMTSLLDCARVLQGRPGGSQPAAPVDASAATTPDSGAGRLSRREQEVASLILDGLTYKQVGDRLFISAKTVEHHVARMRQRLGCASRSELLAQLRQMSTGQSDGELIRPPDWPPAG